LKAVRHTLSVTSDEHVQIIDVTRPIRDIVLEAEIVEGILLANPLHTTCTLLVSEAEAVLVGELRSILGRLVAERAGYKHDDPRYSDCERGNACAHLRAALLGKSVAMSIIGGELSLGACQSILLAELDGPRRRGIDVQILGV